MAALCRNQFQLPAQTIRRLFKFKRLSCFKSRFILLAPFTENILHNNKSKIVCRSLIQYKPNSVCEKSTYATHQVTPVSLSLSFMVYVGRALFFWAVKANVHSMFGSLLLFDILFSEPPIWQAHKSSQIESRRVIYSSTFLVAHVLMSNLLHHHHHHHQHKHQHNNL